jgi:hypothetical protein
LFVVLFQHGHLLGGATSKGKQLAESKGSETKSSAREPVTREPSIEAKDLDAPPPV